MHPELKPLADLLREIAKTEILPRFGHTAATAKADGSLVTEADLAVQRRIQEGMARIQPGIPLLGEEMSALEQEALLQRGGPLWVLDPLDGTSNVACGFPGFAISLALIEGGRTVRGVILDPVRDECFTAVLGGGAALNGAPIGSYAPGSALGDCVACMDFKRLPRDRIPDLLAPSGFRSQRNLGAVALEWCWIAAGRFQLYLHGGQKLWDYAAGRLIASEAGVVSRLYRPYGTEPAEGLDLAPRLAVAAANGELFSRWLEFVRLPLSPKS
jgi:myo-inositol-1(or 4)-monophosphatase